jgi:hypothetical protein
VARSGIARRMSTIGSHRPAPTWRLLHHEHISITF